MSFSDTMEQRRWLAPLLLIGSVFLVYAACLQHDFIPLWDDGDYVLKNDAVRGISPHNLKLAFTSYYVGNYAPIQIVSYMVDYSLWGLAPAGFIATNLLLHGLNGYLVFLLLARVSGARGAALLAALLFTMHPVQVESVAWISERKTVLALFFMLLSLERYDRSARTPRMDGGGRWAYGLSLGFFLLALLTKSVVVVLPLLLLGWDHFVLGKKGWKEAVRPVVPFLFLGIVFSGVAIISQGVDVGGGRLPMGTRPLGMTLLTMLPVLVAYLGMIVMPISLSPWYDPVIRTGVDAQVLLALVLLAALAAVTFLMARRGLRQEVYWVGVFFVGLLPVSNVIPLVTMMNDRYLYLPLLGVSGLACSLLARFGGKRGVVPLAAAGVLVLAALSFKQTAIWKNNLTLSHAAYAHNPESIPVLVHLARSYRSAGLPDKSIELLGQALLRQPDNYEVLFRLGDLLLEQGDGEQAKRYLDRMYQLNPRFIEGLLALGREALSRGSTGDAERYVREALAVNPKDVPARIWLSNLHLERGRSGEARRVLVELLPDAGGEDRAGIYYNLSCVEIQDGKPEHALDWLEKAAAAGFADTEMLRFNRDFNGIRTNPRYHAIERSIAANRGTDAAVWGSGRRGGE